MVVGDTVTCTCSRKRSAGEMTLVYLSRLDFIRSNKYPPIVAERCAHALFVLTKVLRVPSGLDIVWKVTGAHSFSGRVKYACAFVRTRWTCLLEKGANRSDHCICVVHRTTILNVIYRTCWSVNVRSIGHIFTLVEETDDPNANEKRTYTQTWNRHKHRRRHYRTRKHVSA